MTMVGQVVCFDVYPPYGELGRQSSSRFQTFIVLSIPCARALLFKRWFSSAGRVPYIALRFKLVDCIF